MSYDLYFYKQKGPQLTEEQFAAWLTEHLTQPNESETQWFFENEDTEVYFSMDKNEPEADPDSIESFESFAAFDYTHFSFNLNFLRPEFFGIEAFQFVTQLVEALGLFVLDPQSANDNPFRPTFDELFDNWNRTNLGASKDHFKKKEHTYFDPQKSNDSWEFNFHRKRWQEELGEGYYVPKLYFFRTRKDGRAFTLTIWSSHIPMIIPPADYFLLTKEHLKKGKTVKETAMVSRDTVLSRFGASFEPFDHKDCLIIHPEKANSVQDAFNATELEYVLDDFADRVAMEMLFNAKP
ncbi:MAG TPA: hypothetical protein VHE34_10215 [Puia sp.]|uniref:hypothetical protein n=1 Tax=Puia sp. TaxID=2045100 RepID=UPI002C478BA3|nr:hypothetical protein [Puia sp.]HVU95590.1 hypothetical protein [Puia sp.]